ncbi:MAG: GumC family protein, partial [Methanococcaceae archaeon]
IHVKLKDAEDELTNYKAANHIMDLEGSSEDLVRFLSNIEAEKMNTDLELTQYQNKISKLNTEFKEKGFFDQTFLSPQSTDPNNSPFSALMKQLSDLELKRLDLLQKRTENHPDVVNINEQIKQIKAKLGSYNENTLTSYNIIQNSLQKKRDQLYSLANKYEAKMQSLPGKENKLASLTRQRDVFVRMYTMLLDKREEMRMAELTKLQDVIIADYADLPQNPIAPRKIFNILAGFIIGSVFGLLFIFIAEARSKRLISLDDIEDDFNLQIFAIIPNYHRELIKKIEDSVLPEERFVVLGKEQDGFKESFRVLRTKISGETDDKKQVILFTSCEENTGKTTIVSNLALSIAQANKKILIVDCDLRKGTLSRLFDFKLDDPGLLTYLKGKLDLPHIYNRVSDSLYILPSGGVSDNSSDLLASNKMSDLIAYLNDSFYDYIIFDTPPVNYVVDTLVLGKLIKDVVIVIRPDHSFKESVKYGIKEMATAKMNIRGCVINAGDIENSVFKYRYGYGYGYKYGYGENNILKKKKIKS